MAGSDTQLQNEQRRNAQIARQRMMTEDAQNVFDVKGVAFLDEKERQTLDETKRPMLERMRQNLQVIAPVRIPAEKQVDTQFAKGEAKESMFAYKRKMRLRDTSHPLGIKNTNAETLLAKERELIERKEALSNQLDQSFGFANTSDLPYAINATEKNALVNFMTLFEADEQEEAINHANTYASETSVSTYAAHSRGTSMQFFVKKFMALDMDGIDMSTDAAFVASMDRLEKIKTGYECITFFQNSEGGKEYFDRLPEEALKLLNEKMEKAKAYTEYYRARKLLITDPYYRTHLNSEISIADSLENTAQARVTTHLIWLVRSKMKLIGGETAELGERIMQQNYQNTKETQRRIDAIDKNHISNYQYIVAHDDTSFVDDAHRELNVRIASNLRMGHLNYVVTGDTTYQKRHDSPFRGQMIAFPKCFALLPCDKIMQMSDKMNAEPSEELSEAQARALNIEGLKEYIEVVCHHSRYLKDKYGKGMLSLTIEEMSDHMSELRNDFSILQTFTGMLDYARSLPEFQDPKYTEASNQLVFYYAIYPQKMSNSAGVCEGFLSTGNFAKEIVGAMDQGSLEMLDALEEMQNTHADIKWGMEYPTMNA